MTDKLSIKANEEEIEINTSRSDVAAALIRGIVGAAPFIGPLVAEGLSTRIPNQKLDRLIAFTKVLEDKLKYVEEDLIKQKFKTEEFADLLEDALHQASRALSPERKEYIATLIKNGLTADDLDHIGQKKLLAILGQLDDVEISMLYSYSIEDEEKRFQFKSKHKLLVNRWKPDELALYFAHYGQLESAKVIMHGSEFDHILLPLGNLLLRYIGLVGAMDNPA